jgi:hypothetical protein
MLLDSEYISTADIAMFGKDWKVLMINDESRKRLTAYLGECWHDPPYQESQFHDGATSYQCKCGRYEQGLIEASAYRDFKKLRRTFTTPDDFFALVRRIQERGGVGGV